MKDSDVFIRKFVPPDVYKNLLDARFGDEWHDWEPETLLQEVRRVWGVTPLEEVIEKILALQVFVTTHLFWDDPVVFENIILAFNDRHVDPDFIQASTPEEIAYGVTVANRIGRRPKDFAKDVVKYIQASHVLHGQLVYHDVLAFAQPSYEDDFRRDLAKRVRGVLEKGGMEFIDVTNAVEVQQAKTKDCDAYVKERLSKGVQA